MFLRLKSFCPGRPSLIRRAKNYSMNSVPFISEPEIRSLINIKEIVNIQEQTFRKKKNEIILPQRINIQSEYGSTLFMPAYVKNGGLGLKIVSIRPENEKKNLSNLPAVVLLINPETGYPLVMMDASYLTSLRTAAASAVATKYLANYDVHKIAILGAGPVAESHVHTLMAVRGEKVKKIVFWNRTIEKAQKLVEKLKANQQFFGVEFLIEKSADEAVKDSDIIVTATSSEKPLFDGLNIKKGAHINCVGSFLPKMQEVDFYTIKNSRVVVDTLEAALEEAGDLLKPIEKGIIGKDHILAELSQIIPEESSKTKDLHFPENIGAKQVRWDQKDITLFKSCGIATQDITVASYICQSYLQKKNSKL